MSSSADAEGWHADSVQGARSMRCFVWQDDVVLTSRFVRGAMRMVRAASSRKELDVCSAKLAGTGVIIFFLFYMSDN